MIAGSNDPVEGLRTVLANVKPSGAGFTARCPAHDDHNNSLNVDRGEDGRALVRCFAGCHVEQICAALGLDVRDLFRSDRSAAGGRGGGADAGDSVATVQQATGCTLAVYAAAKLLPIERLREWGLSDLPNYCGIPAVKIIYHDEAGQEAAVRFRLALSKSDAGGPRFAWRKGSKVSLYGRHRLAQARERGYVTLVEGESDCHTLWHFDEPAIGVPGANNWNDHRDAPALAGIPIVYAVIERDRGGDNLRDTLADSPLADRVRLIDLGDLKDPSGLYLDDLDRFRERWDEAKRLAMPLAEVLHAERAQAAAADWGACAELAQMPDILAKVADTLAAAGVAGESRVLKLVYLIVVSRLLDRPVSAAIKGPSSGGKSYTMQRVLDLFPERAYYALTAMSERALAYDEEPLAHRVLVLYEAAGIGGDIATYLIRSLLSEGKVRYKTVERTKDGLQPRLIERAAPTGLLVTTTAVHLHSENETRLMSIPVTDTAEQTRAVLRAIASGPATSVDPGPWHALQRWLETGERAVVVPFALALAELVPPAAVRLRRDFPALLTLIRAHALLHRATRERDEQGRIVATVADYAAVRALVADLIAEGVEATVPASVRETVAAVRSLVAPLKADAALADRVRDDVDKTASVSAVAERLGIDKSAASRRVRVAIDKGYLMNREERKGRPARIALGEPLPDDLPILPDPAVLTNRCTVAGAAVGVAAPSPAHGAMPRVRYDETSASGDVGDDFAPFASQLPSESLRLIDFGAECLGCGRVTDGSKFCPDCLAERWAR